MTPLTHPEESIDRARGGLLTPSERASLELHLAECPACAAHLAYGSQFEREVGPEMRDHLLDQRAVAAVMHGLRTRVRRAGSRRWFRLAAAGLLLGVGVATAAVLRARKTSLPAVAERPTPRPAEIAGFAPDRSRAFAPVPPSAEPSDLPDAFRASAPPPRAPRQRHGATAAELFALGHRLRLEGRADAAIAVYRRLQETFPAARESRLSFALAGQLCLDRQRPEDALALFDRHLALGGELAQEALVGRATALEELHRDADAAAAWRRLVERFPTSVYAERARAHLARPSTSRSVDTPPDEHR